MYVEDLLAAAEAAVPRVNAEQARRLMLEEDALLVDVRNPAELAQTGRIAGALNLPRGVIEPRADPADPSRHPDFRLDRPVILYCAAGIRSALAGKALQEMGYRVHNLGGFNEAAQAGLPVEPG